MSFDEFGGGRLPVGTRFAGVLVEREIGRGGAGVVYLARDETLDRSVALKILHEAGQAEDSAAIDRFRAEATLAAKLEHPAIIPIYATGVERGMAYLTMRYVPGRSLEEVITTAGKLPIDEAVRLLRPIAAALDYAADHDIVHRDVKPGNILVDESVTPTRALLSDFGIARAFEGTRHTATGGWVGTPDYIAPEILKDHTPTGRADQYSLACVLVEMISGTSPFKRSNTAATITAQVTETPDLSIIPNLGGQTETAISIALEKNPDDRYATSTEFLDAVQQSIGRDSRATPNTIVRKRKRNKVTRRAKLAGGILLSLIAIAAAGADLLDIRDRIAPTTKGTVAASSSPTDAAADVLILGSKLTTYDDKWKYVKGSNAASVLIASLAVQDATAKDRIKHLELNSISACDSTVRDAIAHPPRQAIVILENPCGTLIVKSLRAMSGKLPPIYNLVNFGNGEDVLIGFSPPHLFDPWPMVDKRLNEQFGPAPLPKTLLLQPAWNTTGVFEAGVVSRRLGLQRCAMFQETPSDDGPVLSQSQNKAMLRAGRGGDDEVIALPIDLTSKAGTERSQQLEREMISAAQSANVDCLVTPFINGTDRWLKRTAPTLLRELPGATLIVANAHLSALADLPVDMKRRVFGIYTFAFLPPAQPLEFSGVIRESFKEGTTDTASVSSLLFLTAALIARTRVGTSPADTPVPTIPAGEWIAAEQGEGYDISAQDVAFDPRSGLTSSYGVTVTSLRKPPAGSADDGVWIYVGGRVDPLDLPEDLRGP